MSEDRRASASPELIRAFDMARLGLSNIEDVPDVTDAWLFVVPDGDVILVVGEGGVKLRVHSQALRNASKVFDAMFGPHWAEGQDLSKENPKEIRLEEDNCDAMWRICCVIHHRNDLLDRPKAKDVLEIAITADKYDLGNALKFASKEWLSFDIDHSESTAFLMVAAFLFQDSHAFHRHVQTLILDHTQSYWDLFRGSEIQELIPFKALCR
ncbi:putative btb poz domain-containing protein [Phaeoacremonium minimum UCRPA7]|uniref:Putative btb poz domain-containing protein n=1 Tax=Phaeoacremonium minimum (strain UCR-PA7) TaxID=1286976 RepID=R8BGL2_PHAM7|nr:putative btb poz domain-containing protein [Phaeoacremonium minimum UCRPA7]EON98475.1 putative btb poz domain-containing protein [Phaeoacremonium minimum UCRPA7]